VAEIGGEELDADRIARFANAGAWA
jgi:hypothetical protein